MRLYVIPPDQQHLLKQNGCERIHFQDYPDPSLEKEFTGHFGFTSLALNYKYRPTDPAVLVKHPHLQYLPTEDEALGKVPLKI